MKTIGLTQGKITIVDDETYEWASKVKWCALKGRNNFYAVRNSLPDLNGKKRLLRLHREIMKSDEGLQVDHINGDTLDNRRENLRNATGQQNGSAYRKLKINKTSKFRGVCWIEERQKWAARIQASSKGYNLGRFDREEDAARAYDRAALEKFGEFAQLNFP